MRTPEQRQIQADYARLKRLAFPELYREANKKYVLAHPDKVKARYKKRWAENKEKEYARTCEWIKNHPEKVKVYKARISKERIREYKRRHYLNRRDHIKARVKKNIQIRKASDPLFRIVCELRTRVYHALKRTDKSAKTMELLGCSVDSFKLYLESLFESGMTWENYGRGGWNIDHIIPLAIFDLSKPEHQRRCFHFSNMRPMWERENFSRPKKPPIQIT